MKIVSNNATNRFNKIYLINDYKPIESDGYVTVDISNLKATGYIPFLSYTVDSGATLFYGFANMTNDSFKMGFCGINNYAPGPITEGIAVRYYLMIIYKDN